MLPGIAGWNTFPVRSSSAEDVAILLGYAQRVIVVPGYGLAVAQAQHTMAELAAAADGTPEDDVFVIGGGSVYAALLSRCRRAYITRVEAVDAEADTFFPNLDKLPGWEIEQTSEPITENGVTYRFVDYRNQNVR